eukprot:CAMPEP_0180833796 /NCGR_PEP_ID=MMETSP1038_2-20121128/77533_1 /TAXON_ID=632150 /ORGANISM="Azadinium spinosum, Strain 3D9" /LENGTH=99 /DNA_ID=CAMNT_0022877025 /DNA_START=459 /DNA_END=758 /DNA_ORIENTATION=+
MRTVTAKLRSKTLRGTTSMDAGVNCVIELEETARRNPTLEAFEIRIADPVPDTRDSVVQGQEDDNELDHTGNDAEVLRGEHVLDLIYQNLHLCEAKKPQ